MPPLLLSFYLLIVTGFLSACSSVPIKLNPHQAHPSSVESPERGWWYAKFRHRWPEDADPAWHMDLLLAHQVIMPVLDKYTSEIEFWRFHRRAGRDLAGHQFSFIFFAKSDVAAIIYESIEADETLKALMTQGAIERLTLDNTAEVKLKHIEDASDRVWNEIIQKSWPHYIMGASKMWLDMIDRLFIFNQDKNESAEELYRHLNLVITQLWEQEGSHAFLHHLNGLFAYKPMVVIQRNLMTF